MPPYPEQPDYYSEDTQAAPYSGYDPEPGRPEPPTPWYRRPLALVGAGAIGVVVLGLAVYAVINLASGSPAHSPATTTPTPSATASTTATTTPAEPTRRRGGPGAPPETVTQTVTPEPSATDTSTVPPSDTATTTAPPTTQTSTVTQTVTVPPRRPFQPRP